MSLTTVFAALAADQSALEGFLRQLPAGVCVYDHEGQALVSNDAFARLAGDPAAAARADAPLSPWLARARAGQPVVDTDIEWTTDSGPQRARLSAWPIRDEGRTSVLVLLNDGSGEAGQRETLGIVGHDLRNPLAAIRMTAQLLGKPDEMAPERRLQLSKRILTSSSRMDAIVKSLLDYARARAGAIVKLEPESVDLGALAARVIEDLTANVTGRSVELRTHGDLQGHWDPSRLEQILGHLVSNALRHGAEGVSVMTLTGSDDHVEIAMVSQGPPIDGSLVPHIFDPFRIGPVPEGAPRRNIGLGLFVVRELARAHGGRVSVESSASSGTRFTVVLPRLPVTPA